LWVTSAARLSKPIMNYEIAAYHLIFLLIIFFGG